MTFLQFSQLPQARIFISVLKWAMVSSGSLSIQKIPICPEDISNLITARIPIFVDKPGAAEATVPIIMALEGPPGISNRTFLLCYLFILF